MPRSALAPAPIITRWTPAPDSSSASAGPIPPAAASPPATLSLKFNGVEYQDQSKGSQIGSGLGAASVSATTYGTSYIKITVNDGAGLTHYYMARNGYPNVYMGTYFTSEPSIGNVRTLCASRTHPCQTAPRPQPFMATPLLSNRAMSLA